LRREEVAVLAGVSVSWYTWLEQGRPITASRQVLLAVAAALRLDPVETDHLLGLAGLAPAGVPTPAGAALPEDLGLLLDVLEPAPAYVLDPLWNFLGVNEAHARLFPQLGRLPAAQRNLVWLVFADPDYAALLDGWDDEARRVLSQFRAESTAIRRDPAATALVERLCTASAHFAEWWPRHDVAAFESRVRTFHHPVAGPLRFRHEELTPAAHPGLRVVVHLPLPGDDSVQRLRHSGHFVA
jgi:transcriptional regulator with XRE-family HTH domain